ncbi:hypothetical protein, partial [Serratia marcescens]|uniref:hypothetical protein n=1 Tax=Serratia marcescens TaxID=615 RepID=UPI0028131544
MSKSSSSQPKDPETEAENAHEAEETAQPNDNEESQEDRAKSSSPAHEIIVAEKALSPVPLKISVIDANVVIQPTNTAADDGVNHSPRSEAEMIDALLTNEEEQYEEFPSTA